MDPLALHHIVVKDQEVFQETATFTKYVVIPSIDTEFSPGFRGLKIIFGEGLLATVGEQHRKQVCSGNCIVSLCILILTVMPYRGRS